MMPAPMMMLPALLGGLALLAAPALILIGLLGRPRSTRPRCRACRTPLTARAELPSACPNCAADLSKRRAVRFSGYRPRVLPLLLGVGLLALLAAPAFIAPRLANQGTRIVNGVLIERGVTEARFEEAMAGRGEQAWSWLSAHLQEGELAPALRARAVEILREALSSEVEAGEGGAPVTVASLSGMSRFAACVAALDDPKLVRELAQSLLDQISPPQLRVRASGGDALTIELWWPQRLYSMPWPRAFPGMQGQQLLMTATEVRIDGQAVRPTRPGGRVLLSPTPTQIVLSWPEPKREAASGEPDETDRIEREIEIDFDWALLDNPPATITQQGLPGPPQSWPGVLGARKATLRATLSP